MKILAYFVVLSSTLLFSGCSTVSYYSQSARGHLSLIAKQKDISRLLQDKDISTQRKKDLKLIQEIRHYAHDKLKLPKNGSYTKFVELNREAVTWVVVVTPKYSMTPSQWCFPIVGCISYKGYFSEAKAKQEAKRIQKLGYDVYVGGSPAYSTLGWFNDPVVSPMLDQGIIIAAETIFHELAHQQVYHKNDTDFNEAFASVVGQVGAQLWLKEKHPKALAVYEEHLNKQRQFIGLLLKTSDKLKGLYRIKMPDFKTEKQKRAILAQLKIDYQKLKQTWDGDNRYDAWFDTPANNARLALTGTYYRQIPKLTAQLKAYQYDFEPFYQEMEKRSTIPKKRASKINHENK